MRCRCHRGPPAWAAALARQERRQNPVADEPPDHEEEAAAAGQVRHPDGEEREVPDAVHVGRHAEAGPQVPVFDPAREAPVLGRTGDQGGAQEKPRLADAGPGRLEHRRRGDAPRVGQAIEVDHLLAQRDDERHPQDAAGDAAEHHQGAVEVGVAEDEQGGQGEHHPGGGAVDPGGQGLDDVVLDDRVAPQGAAQDPEAEDRRELGALDRESQLERQVADRDGDQRPDRVAGEDRGQGDLWVGAVPDRAR